MIKIQVFRIIAYIPLTVINLKKKKWMLVHNFNFAYHSSLTITNTDLHL